MIFEPDFIEFIELLNKHKVRYLIIGAHALAYHGRPRHTGDLDIWIKPESENASKMIAVLKDFGFESVGFKEEDFLKENYVSQIGYPPLRIDILSGISGVGFDEAYQNKIDAEVDGLETPFINLQDFIATKVASGRAKDLADIKELQKRIKRRKP